MQKISFVRSIISCFGVVAALALLNGCRPSSDAGGHGHAHDDAHSHSEDHAPPHGGTPVLVAADEFHLELVHDPTEGRMRAYVLDGHLESYVPVAETQFQLMAKAGGKEEELAFRRVPEPGSDTKSSAFEAQADWLKSVKAFDGKIAAITLDGRTFTNIAVSFPKGSKHVH